MSCIKTLPWIGLFVCLCLLVQGEGKERGRRREGEGGKIGRNISCDKMTGAKFLQLVLCRWEPGSWWCSKVQSWRPENEVVNYPCEFYRKEPQDQAQTGDSPFLWLNALDDALTEDFSQPMNFSTHLLKPSHSYLTNSEVSFYQLSCQFHTQTWTSWFHTEASPEISA